jgi:hypothetical protein
MGEGVTCAACHVRDGVVIGARAAPGAPHPVAVSAELSDSRFCATCHQLTWPGASAPFYDTWGEWQASAYAAAGVSCQDCHMPLQAGAAVSSTWAAAPAHTFEADLGRALSLLLELSSPEVQRGQPWSVKVRIQNTGAGHAVPTGSPFKTYVVAAELVGADGKPLAAGGRLELGRKVSEAPPWDILSDHRVAPGGEVVMEHRFEVPAKATPQTAALVLSVRRSSAPADAPPLLRRTLPVPVL